MFAAFRGRSWNLELKRESIDVTSDRPSPNERWRYTDKAGHEHFYQRGYPTLELVVDAEHWCDGTEGLYNHDAHMTTDQSHYECLLCRQVVEPAVDPPFSPKSIPGRIDGCLSGFRSDGAEITMYLVAEEWESIQGAEDPDVEALRILDNAPGERIYSLTVPLR